MSDTPPKLRLAAPDHPAVSAQWLEREQALTNRDREFGLEQSLGKFRVGSVKALNAVPLTRGLEHQIVYDVPAKLAQMLQRDELDAALVSVVEALFHDRYDILNGIAVASLGEVKSVFLAHRKPVEAATEVFCDPASLTSVTLLKVLLAERGLKPEFKPLEDYAAAREKDFVLLIGDPALDFYFANELQPTHEIFDLGAA
jgi:chorismate dehydratase